MPPPRSGAGPRGEPVVPRNPPTVFFPLRDGPLRLPVRVDAAGELSAVLLDDQGAPVATLLAPTVVPVGDAEVSWNGVLPSGQWADFGHPYRILIQLGVQSWVRDVMPVRE